VRNKQADERFVREHQGKHFCKCGCGNPIAIKYWQRWVSTGFRDSCVDIRTAQPHRTGAAASRQRIAVREVG
jgi:hypothetical protein